MLRGDLSTRPFYNDRLVRTGLGVLALVALGLTVFNAVEILRLERAGREARQTVAGNNEQARALREQARVIRQSINQVQLDAVQTSAREANALIDRRAFSWTELLNYFQKTLPPDVRITRVTPQVDNTGRLLVAVSAYARRVDDLNEFMDALEDTGAFSGVINRQDSVDDDGTWRSELQAYYSATTTGPPSASEPGEPPPADAAPAAPSEPTGGRP